MENGQTVFLSFCGYRDYDHAAEGFVQRATVIDAEHGVYKTEHGGVRCVESFERVHATAAEAWAACAAELESKADEVRRAADACRAKSQAVAEIVMVPA